MAGIGIWLCKLDIPAFLLVNSSPMNRVIPLLNHWEHDPTIADNVVEWHVDPGQSGNFVEFPSDLHPGLQHYLRVQGICQLYTHQLEAWQLVRSGSNLVIVTGTASGKTLCYNLPVLDQALRDPDCRALYLFPTKALTQDQYQSLYSAVETSHSSQKQQPISISVYDGDTPSASRSDIRKKSRLVLTNPDMLHTGILPHHTRWAEFFRNLRYVIIDEIHIYRGVFGSHVANVIRRLKRVASFYGAHPQFILTSATISNPGSLASRLIEQPVDLIDQDGAPHGNRHFLLYNPPIINPELGLRASSVHESVRLAGDLLDLNIQTLMFCRARRTVEMMLMYLQQTRGNPSGELQSYRSGYLPSDRRSIERGLRQGTARAVVATNALELGIDIGDMDSVILGGYPGSIASTRQQAGRAGRKQDASLAVLVASANPIDQFLMQHPEFIFDRSPEQALINPDNLLILLQHVRCAAFELPFTEGEPFGNLPPGVLSSLLQVLAQAGEIFASTDRYFWMSDRYPAEGVSLRSSSPQPVLLQLPGGQNQRTIAEVDYESALWMVHPQAIYLQSGQMFEVQTLDLDNRTALLKQVDVDYYTEPRKSVEIEKLSLLRRADVPGGCKHLGEVMVTTRVTGFRRVRWFTSEVLSEGDLDLPETQLRTVGYWLSIDTKTVEHLREAGLWNSDRNDYGPGWPALRSLVLQRDHYACQVCGAGENIEPLHVHHKVPLRSFASLEQANRLDNLITLCSKCHRRAETQVMIRSGLAGLSYVLVNLAPLFLMCDITDLGAQSDSLSPLADKQPAVVLYDLVPAGIGLSETLYDIHADLVQRAYELVSHCGCSNGCPSCVGPVGMNGVGGKEETLALLSILCAPTNQKE